ncbi:MAG: hypothetical protein A2057_14660 [Ignavibacteria bacterium GWA2_35_9]|nr:MAG: hypothetical protein A2057_14660 [Ignavibacteria bacterium GWA2_35_9]OGU46504.1 MAG: hypothetical protein A2000_13875 [Ignavibacteria bacterium GWB2_36_8]OGU48890.1 MAG: hypothetical protein A2080_13360 [Ignavibacteria bacterium GWC2_36_12]
MLRLVSTSVKTQFYECRKITPPLIGNYQKLVILNQFKSISIAFLFSVFVLKLSSASNVLNPPQRKNYKKHSDDSEKRIKIFFRVVYFLTISSILNFMGKELLCTYS